MQKGVIILLFSLNSLLLWAGGRDSARIAISLQTPDSAKSIVDKMFSALEIKTKHATYNLYPAVGYDPSSGVELGMMPIITIPPKQGFSRSKYYRPSTIFTRFSYSTKNWVSFAADFKVYTPKEYVVNHLFEIQNIPESYYGIGYNDEFENATRYMSFRYGMRGDASKGTWENWQLGVKYDFNYASVSDVEGLLLHDSVIGYKGGMVGGLGPIISYDTRDDADYPLKGAYYSVSSMYYPALTEQNYVFAKNTVDFRHYLNPVFDFVIAMQVFGEFTRGDVPFYLLPRLAGKDRLRGFSHRSKYVDNSVVFSQVEIRKHLFWKLGAVAFASVGNAIPDIQTDPSQNLKYVYGFGGRFAASSDSKINFRLDMGFGSNGDVGVFMTAREAF